MKKIITKKLYGDKWVELREMEMDIPKKNIKGKYTYLLQVFQNLLSNAIKYRRTEEDPTISISVKLDNNTFTFVVKDNGTGMAKEDLERIFMPFTRLVSRQEAEGNGIGLATVKKIIAHHGGKIWADSEEGAGSTFYFSLPSTLMQLETNVRAVA